MLRPTICITGPEAAQLFYDRRRFMRQGAAPEPVRATLFGKRGVQVLDGEEHRQRKEMFMALMTPERVAQLADITAEQWRTYAHKWASQARVTLYDELQEMLTRAVCSWAGVPLPEADVGQRTRELAALFDNTASRRHLWSRRVRKRAESWMADIVRQVRTRRLAAAPDTPLYAVATQRKIGGGLLDPRTAAVEMLNLLRPTVAVSVYIVFVAHALHQHPECRKQLEAGDAAYAEYFVQEVRRFCPFFPSVLARARHGFEWRGYRFPRGRRVILDLYGINHDARTWAAPDEFRPERFAEWDHGLFNFVPQGGGDPHTGHRCPGEAITVALMKVALDHLVRRLAYDVPTQDLAIDYKRLPALPRSRFIISNVQPAVVAA